MVCAGDVEDVGERRWEQRDDEKGGHGDGAGRPSPDPRGVRGSSIAAQLWSNPAAPTIIDPTWSRLGGTGQALLLADGCPLWHGLVELLQPEVVVVSVARRHLARIRFEALGPSERIHSFGYTADGEPRSRSYDVDG